MATETVGNESARLKGVSRRDVLIGAGVTASVAEAGAAIAGTEAEPHTMQHKYFAAAAYKKHVALVAAANECIAKGQACISHCMETFLTEDTTMGKCAYRLVTDGITAHTGIQIIITHLVLMLEVILQYLMKHIIKQ